MNRLNKLAIELKEEILYKALTKSEYEEVLIILDNLIKYRETIRHANL